MTKKVKKMSNKKQLHPNLYNHCMGETGNSRFHGGSLDLFGISLDIDWNEKDSSWSISNTNCLSDEDMQKSLSMLFEALKSEFTYRVFSDEENIAIEEFVERHPDNKVFWTDDGKQYIFAQKHVSQDMYICIQLKKSKGGSKHRRFELTQKVKIFSGEYMVYSYPGEYYGKVQSHASENGAD